MNTSHTVALREIAGALVELLPEWSASPKSAYMVTPPGMARPARVRVLHPDFAARTVRCEVAGGLHSVSWADVRGGRSLGTYGFFPRAALADELLRFEQVLQELRRGLN